MPPSTWLKLTLHILRHIFPLSFAFCCLFIAPLFAIFIVPRCHRLPFFHPFPFSTNDSTKETFPRGDSVPTHQAMYMQTEAIPNLQFGHQYEHHLGGLFDQYSVERALRRSFGFSVIQLKSLLWAGLSADMVS